MTYDMRCDYCRMNLDLVGKMENEAEDTTFLLYKLNRTEEIDEIVRNVRHISSQKSSMEITKHYFNQLSKLQRDELYEIYKLDFWAFDYDYSIFN